MPGAIQRGSHGDYSLRSLHGCGKGVFVLIAWQLGTAAWQVGMALGSLSHIHPLCLTLMGICLGFKFMWCPDFSPSMC